MRYYITKYALTSGIIVSQEGEARESGDLLCYRPPGALFDSYLHGDGKDWHKSAMAAVERAEVMRKKKIESLKKSIAKIEKIKFQVPA